MISKIIGIGILLFSSISTANAGWFSSKQGKVFETRGLAVIQSSSTFTAGTEQRDIQIPQYIDVTKSERWSGLHHDSESGWTLCRVPLKGKISWQGVKDRSLVFECKPLSYFK